MVHRAGVLHLGDSGTAGHSEQQREVGTGPFFCLLPSAQVENTSREQNEENVVVLLQDELFNVKEEGREGEAISSSPQCAVRALFPVLFTPL